MNLEIFSILNNPWIKKSYSKSENSFNWTDNKKQHPEKLAV